MYKQCYANTFMGGNPSNFFRYKDNLDPPSKSS